jgi:dihydroneopterin aldolase
MLNIHLHQLRFHAFHGLYPEEQVLGNDFLVDISIQCTTILPVTDLGQSVNYASVYELVKEIMARPVPLLETLAWDMAQQILARFSQAATIEISIRKENPPIEAIQGSVGISISVTRS